MEKQLYNLYQDGKILLKDVSAEQAMRKIGMRFKPAYYADKGVLFKGIYRIERSRIEQDYNEIRVKREMLLDWEQLTEPFRHVLWVKEPGNDVRVLIMGGKASGSKY